MGWNRKVMSVLFGAASLFEADCGTTNTYEYEHGGERVWIWPGRRTRLTQGPVLPRSAGFCVARSPPCCPVPTAPGPPDRVTHGSAPGILVMAALLTDPGSGTHALAEFDLLFRRAQGPRPNHAVFPPAPTKGRIPSSPRRSRRTSPSYHRQLVIARRTRDRLKTDIEWPVS